MLREIHEHKALSKFFLVYHCIYTYVCLTNILLWHK